MIMAFFRTHNAAVTLGQLFKTGIAEALVKTLFGFPATVAAMNFPLVLHGQLLPQQLIQWQQLIANGQLVGNLALAVVSPGQQV